MPSRPTTASASAASKRDSRSRAPRARARVAPASTKDTGTGARREDGPGDREQRREGTGAGRETGRGVDKGGDRRDDAHGKHPYRGEADAEELHPTRDDQEAPGREELEEVAIEHLAAEDPRRPVEQDAFIAEPLDVAEERGADERRAQRDSVEQRIAEERWAPGQHPP